MFIYIDFLIKKILKRKQNVIMVFICFFVIVFIYVMNINSQKILRDSLASQIKMSEKAINDKTKIMESNDVDDSSIQSLQKEIDEINILRASFLAMHRAVDQLTTRPQHLLIDGNRFTKYPGVPHTTVVKGDGKYLSIAAASILAKTYRDDYMNRLHEEFPYYDWDHNKGYPTKKHRAAIAERGTTPYHRMTFNLLGDGQLTLSF